MESWTQTYLILGLVVGDGEAVGDLHGVFVHHACKAESGVRGAGRSGAGPRRGRGRGAGPAGSYPAGCR